MVKTKMWGDPFVRALDEKRKTLWVYLLTNVHTHICGFYELDLEVIAFESGLKEKDVQEGLAMFSGKIEYIDGWVCIKNYAKHQNAANSPKVRAAIEKALGEVPEHVQEQAQNAFQNGSLFLNSKSNSNSKSKSVLSIVKGKGIDTLYGDDWFKKFWEAYPKKTGKGEAWKSWQKLAPSETLGRQILAAVEAYKKTQQWQKDGGQYVPNPATFLNQRRFDDTPQGSVGSDKYSGV